MGDGLRTGGIVATFVMLCFGVGLRRLLAGVLVLVTVFDYWHVRPFSSRVSATVSYLYV